MAQRKDSRKQNPKKGECLRNGKALRDAVGWAVDQQIFSQLKLHGNTAWNIIDLILLTVVWVWSNDATLTGAFAEAHRLGMFTVLWCYLRNSAFKVDGVDYSLSADLTGQANHMGVTIEADIIKQKQPENNGGYNVLKYGKTDPLVYDELTTDNPIDLTRWQLANCYMGRVPLINSGGESKGEGPAL